MKTHKISIKWKLFRILNEEQAKSIFNVLIKSEVKVKLHDPLENIFIYSYLTDVVLEKLNDLEKIIENTNLTNKQKQEIYYIVKRREDEQKKTTDGVIQNIIDEVLKLDK